MPEPDSPYSAIFFEKNLTREKFHSIIARKRDRHEKEKKYGQITITSDKIPHQVGTYAIYNEADSIEVNLGTPGGGRTWDFTSQVTDDSYGSWIVNKSETPFADSFPTANLVSKQISTYKDSAIIYIYSRLATDAMTSLGRGIISPDTTITTIFDEPTVEPLPMNYENSWHLHGGFSDTTEAGAVYKYEEYGYHLVDAWGTVSIPYGPFNCLRIRQYDTTAITVFYMGMPVYGDTTAKINYTFMVENYGTVVSISSYEGETDPNFTNASSLSRLSYFTTGISENEPLTQNFELHNYPNPFTKSTEISFTLPTDGSQRVKIV